MPAVTPTDLALVGKIPTLSGVARPVVSIHDAPKGFEGEGFPVRRAFHGVSMARLDPFVHMDQMGEVEYAPGEPKGTPWHPHRGFETVTYMIDGTFQHQDSIGGGGLITDGGTQWMTAGEGILHIERPPDDLVASGGLFHGMQLWVNLPSAKKFVPAHYQDIKPDAVSLAVSADGGALVRIIAGSLDAIAGPGSTHTPISLLHATIQPGARLGFMWPKSFNALVYALSGSGAIANAPFHGGQLVVLGDGDGISIEGLPSGGKDTNEPTGRPLEVLILGGQPIGEPVVAYGPFVMNTREEIAQAFEDFEAGKLGTIPAQ
jgi:redox-sensitive bicupin YhaK (pirin superfamily)